MTGYVLKISDVGSHFEFSLRGPQLNCSSRTDITKETILHLAKLYYGVELDQGAFSLLQDVERNFLPPGSVRHHSSSFPRYVRAYGQYIFRKLLPRQVADSISRLPPSSLLMLEVDDSASGLPWELLYDDHNFLCLEHVLGRVPASARGTHEPVMGPIPMLMVANPTGNLIGAQNEANYIISQLRGSNIRISRFGSEIRKNDYLQLLESGKYNLIHYSGHSASSSEAGKSCHAFSDDLCYGYEIERLRLSNPPHLVFSNSCQSAESSLDENETGNTSLAGSYLKAGVGGCVGTIWSVSDVGSSEFASDFYRYLLFGATLGEALLNARRNSFKKWGYDNLIWGSYILFGDPGIRLVKRT